MMTELVDRHAEAIDRKREQRVATAAQRPVCKTKSDEDCEQKTAAKVRASKWERNIGVQQKV